MALALSWVGQASAGPSARSLVADGNEAYAAGDYAKALEAYSKASVDVPESAVVAFNQGDACFRQGDLAKAREFFEKAALKTQDLAFEANGRYNLGNVELWQAQRQRDADPRRAVESYQQAIRQYQDALRLRPGHADAAHNLEVARILMKNLLDELQRNPEAAKQRQQQNQSLQELLKELIREQEGVAAANRRLTSRRQGGAKEGLPKDIRELANDQQATRDKTSAVADRLDQAKKEAAKDPKQGPSPTERGGERVKRASSAQGAAVDNLRKEDLDAARPEQDKALGHLKRALEELGGDPTQCSSCNAGQGQPRQDQEKQDAQAKQSPDKQGKKGAHPKAAKADREKKGPKPREELAREILREERANKDKRTRQLQGGYAPVDRDW